jgi:hypothetical protein
LLHQNGSGTTRVSGQSDHILSRFVLIKARGMCGTAARARWNGALMPTATIRSHYDDDLIVEADRSLVGTFGHEVDFPYAGSSVNAEATAECASQKFAISPASSSRRRSGRHGGHGYVPPLVCQEDTRRNQTRRTSEPGPTVDTRGLRPVPTLSLRGGNRCSCPQTDIRGSTNTRPPSAETRHSRLPGM